MNAANYRYTLEEVSRHNGLNGAKTWIVIKDLVYDVTEYKDKHPGGNELIDEYAGQDATSEFDGFGHSSDAKQMLKKYFIGELVDGDKKANRNKKGANLTKINIPKGDNRKRRTFLKALCGKCTA